MCWKTIKFLFITLFLAISFIFLSCQYKQPESTYKDKAYPGSVTSGPEGDIYVWNSHNAIFQTTDNGNTWDEVNTGPLTVGEYPCRYTITINSPGHFFATNGKDGLYRSTDRGKTWCKISLPLYMQEVLSIAINSDSDIFVGTDGWGIFRSTQNGDTWENIPTGLIDYSKISGIAVNANDDIFVCTESKIFWSPKSLDKWAQINTAPLHYPQYVLTCPSGDVFSIGRPINTWRDNNYSVYSLKANNIGWDHIFTTLKNIQVHHVAMSVDRTIFIITQEGEGTDNQLKRSTDNGNTWKEIQIE